MEPKWNPYRARGIVTLSDLIQMARDIPDAEDWAAFRKHFDLYGICAVPDHDLRVDDPDLHQRVQLMTAPPFDLEVLPESEQHTYARMEMGATLIEHVLFTTPLALGFVRGIEQHSDAIDHDPVPDHSGHPGFSIHLDPHCRTSVNAYLGTLEWIRRAQPAALPPFEQCAVEHLRSILRIPVPDLVEISGFIQQEWKTADDKLWQLVHHAATLEVGFDELVASVEEADGLTIVEHPAKTAARLAWATIKGLLGALEINLVTMCSAKAELCRGKLLIELAQREIVKQFGTDPGRQDATESEQSDGTPPDTPWHDMVVELAETYNHRAGRSFGDTLCHRAQA
jgi:hypothetical protein